MRRAVAEVRRLGGLGRKLGRLGEGQLGTRGVDGQKGERSWLLPLVGGW